MRLSRSAFGFASDPYGVSRFTPLRTTINRTPAPVLSPEMGNTQRQLISVGLSPAMDDSPQILTVLANLGKQYGQSPIVRQAAESALPSRIGNNNIDGQIMAVVGWVRDHMRYVRDPYGIEYIIAPPRLIQTIDEQGYALGDCDDHVLLLNSMLASLGIFARPIGVKLHDPKLYDHVITQAYGSRGWIDIDPCIRNAPTPVYRDRLVPA